MNYSERDEPIVIVGGGICGLATALALHRNGIKSLVLERCDTLRATGAGIAIYTNGWRALDQLGVGKELRQKAFPITVTREISVDDGVQQEIPSGKEEFRCLKRTDLIETLAKQLPPKAIRFGSQVVAIKTGTKPFNHVVHLQDGSLVNTKVLIGCDGVNSLVAETLQLKPSKLFSSSRTRGYTEYPNGHGFGCEFVRTRKGSRMFGRIPINDKLVYWFLGQPSLPEATVLERDPKLIKEVTIEAMQDFPAELIEMVSNADLSSLNLSRPWYRAPWELLGALQRGSMTVAGDAMHPMSPFLGQGGSAALEDAVVLGRCLVREMNKGLELEGIAGVALDAFVKERRMRVLGLSTRTYLSESMVESASVLKRFVFGAILKALFSGGGAFDHAQYDCGPLE